MRVVFRALPFPPNKVKSPIALPVGTVSGTWHVETTWCSTPGNGVGVEHEGQVVLHVSRWPCFPVGRGGVKPHLLQQELPVARGDMSPWTRTPWSRLFWMQVGRACCKRTRP